MSPSNTFPIVGVGASAGGLDAFTSLLKALPEDTGMGFVLVQHMDPTRESMLAPLLKKFTAMPVGQAVDGAPVERNRIYVIPPNTIMSIERGALSLTKRKGPGDSHRPIDHFLTSLAQDRAGGSIGIIFSGVGSDGTAGLRAIKTEGGITFAQDQISAQHAGMPASAVDAGCVDFVLPPAEIATELARMSRHPFVAPAPHLAPIELQSAKQRHRDKIFELLHSHAGVDFSQYKPGTINRRILRRMVVTKCEEIANYVRRLENDSSEIQALFDDIFIHVTSFFREPEVFDTLKAKVFPKVKSATPLDSPIRIWVPGCSSGEEVYSIAISLVEFLGDGIGRARIQIFGTDISEKDVQRARAGIYPEASVATLSEERLRRFFFKRERGYEVIKFIREMCLFARHDLAKDPPFSKVSLISCRNVLIYVGPKLQERFLAVFHYALKPNGYLVLGSSESISGNSQIFEPADRKARIYIRKEAHVQPLFELRAVDFERFSQPKTAGRPTTPTLDFRKAGERVVLEQYSPAGFFVDSALNVIHFQGDTSPFLRPSHGSATLQLLRLIRPELMVPLRTAIHDVKSANRRVRRDVVLVGRAGEAKPYTLEVAPLPRRPDEIAGFVVLFVGSGAPSGQTARQPEVLPEEDPNASNAEIERLKSELKGTRDFLRISIEDQEANAEELNAANEEILSSNEELQTANEELQTAKEELQSSNEELSTVNEELRDRNKELDQLAGDLTNLLAAVEIPIVILSHDLRIRRFTPAAEKLFNLLPSDVGRRFSDFRPAVRIPDFEETIREVGASSRKLDRDVESNDGRWYSLRVRPYGNGGKSGRGVLISLIDITKTKRSAIEAIQQTESKLAAILEHTPAYVYLKDLKGRYLMINRSYERMLNISSEQVKGKRPSDVFSRSDANRFLADTRSVIKSGAPGTFEQDFNQDGKRSTIHCVEFPLRDSKGKINAVCGICNDITERKRMETRLHALGGRVIKLKEERFRALAREIHDVLGQELAALGFHFGEVKQHLDQRPAQLRKAIKATQSDIAQLAQSMHDISRRLHPVSLEELGLVETLRNDCRVYSRQYGIPVEFRSRGVSALLPADLRLCAYRIATESLLNVVKHSGARKAKVSLSNSRRQLVVRVQDNGEGFDRESVRGKQGLGLVSMEERARLAGGTISIETKQGSGTTVVARLPIS